MYWLIFWFHIVILYKISFHLIGHTIWFYIEIRFSYFEPPLLFCNGDSKNENFNSLQKYRVRPIKWKGILHRLTIWNQKFSQYIPEESALKLDLFFSDFEDYSKSAQGMILFLLVMFLHSNTTQKCGKTHCNRIFHSVLLQKLSASSCLFLTPNLSCALVQ